jgi:hypothetical protein
MAAGMLLLLPQTTTLGALIGFADMLQVFVLNMTYDFGLKQVSLHYLLMFALLISSRRRAPIVAPASPRSPSASISSACSAGSRRVRTAPTAAQANRDRRSTASGTSRN